MSGPGVILVGEGIAHGRPGRELLFGSGNNGVGFHGPVSLPFVNANSVAVGIGDHGDGTGGTFEWTQIKWDPVSLDMADGFLKILHFEHKSAAGLFRRLGIGPGCRNGQGMGADLILQHPLVGIQPPVNGLGGGKPQNLFIKPPGTAKA